MEAASRILGARVNTEFSLVHHRDESTLVRPVPISVDFHQLQTEAQTPEVTAEMERLTADWNLQDKIVGLGIDRIDYTKGIPHRIRAINRFLEQNPQYRGQVVFIQAGVMSRTNIIAYQELADQIDRLLDDVNSRFATDNWQPIIYMPTDLPNLTLMALRRLARFCVVSSLHDGMNLVAKEYVASRYDHDGVLILSPFTGAALELTDALIVNPYDTERFAAALREAVEMPCRERQVRMANMRNVVQENNIYKMGRPLPGRYDASRPPRPPPHPHRLKAAMPHPSANMTPPARRPIRNARTAWRPAMPHLLNVWPAITAQLQRANRILALFDYDGTLTPIAPRPQDAILPDETRQRLTTLTNHPRYTVGLVSGPQPNRPRNPNRRHPQPDLRRQPRPRNPRPQPNLHPPRRPNRPQRPDPTTSNPNHRPVPHPRHHHRGQNPNPNRTLPHRPPDPSPRNRRPSNRRRRPPHPKRPTPSNPRQNGNRNPPRPPLAQRQSHRKNPPRPPRPPPTHLLRRRPNRRGRLSAPPRQWAASPYSSAPPAKPPPPYTASNPPKRSPKPSNCY